MSPLVMVGLNFRFAPLALRERVAFTPEHMPKALLALRRQIAASAGVAEADVETAILSTCNRAEVYAWADHAESASRAILDFLCAHITSAGSATTFPADDELAQYFTVFTGLSVCQHLMRVASGLESMVVGENEILGQVRTAGDLARSIGVSGPNLSALFRYAVQAGKRARSETDLGIARLSVATIVVELAQELQGPLAEQTALLIGAGKISALAGRALVRAGLRCVLVANRAYPRAEKLARDLGGQAVHFDCLEENLRAADIIICSTSAPHIVLHAGAVRAAMQSRPQRPLLVADLAVPRDADPQIATIPNVRMISIDDLDALVQSRHPMGAVVRQQVEKIVAEETQAYATWLTARSNADVIRLLRAQADLICQQQVDQALHRMGAVSPQQQRLIQAMGEAIVGKLLHHPITCLREPPDGVSPSQVGDLVEELFQLNKTG